MRGRGVSGGAIGSCAEGVGAWGVGAGGVGSTGVGSGIGSSEPCIEGDGSGFQGTFEGRGRDGAKVFEYHFDL